MPLASPALLNYIFWADLLESVGEKAHLPASLRSGFHPKLDSPADEFTERRGGGNKVTKCELQAPPPQMQTIYAHLRIFHYDLYTASLERFSGELPVILLGKNVSTCLSRKCRPGKWAVHEESRTLIMRWSRNDHLIIIFTVIVDIQLIRPGRSFSLNRIPQGIPLPPRVLLALFHHDSRLLEEPENPVCRLNNGWNMS